ncbi:MAG: CRISPR-associated endoribonuclease Cas6 [Dysgonamonadaceae bacterium]|jgi:CRISPR-associated endoribonuclease Cas6|nr:CRISPR-associated endoribonuclease Cas6 [Dysgonamonadaceae bacterium]
MRFKLNLNVNPHAFGNKLPINYQYELSAWIYSVIAKGDRQYAKWLHENGFSEGYRNFKLFVFSNIYSPGIKFDKDRLIFTSDKASFYLSFLPERSTEEFIKGVFKEQEFTLGDRISKMQFRLQQVEMIPSPDFSESFVFKTLSPVVVSVGQENGYPHFSSPEEEGYGQSIINNLKKKYSIFYNKEFSGDMGFRFELLSPVRSKLIRIKAGTRDESQVRGFVFTFRLEADKELLKVMYDAGMGEKGSQGFGCVEEK